MKQCKKCKVSKEEKEFRNNKKKEDGLDIYCKICQRQLDKERYNKSLTHNREYIYKRKKEHRKRNFKFVIDYLKDHPCIDCGEKDIVVLEFDHLGDKKYSISGIIQNSSIERLETEIAKCEVRCANCHRRKTAKDRNYYRLENQY